MDLFSEKPTSESTGRDEGGEATNNQKKEKKVKGTHPEENLTRYSTKTFETRQSGNFEQEWIKEGG